MEPSIVHAEQEVKAGLARVRRRWFLHLWSRVAARWVLLTLAIVAAVIGVLALARPTGMVLVGAVLAVFALSLAALGVVGWPWRLRPGVELESVTLATLSQEVVVGLMGLTLMNPGAAFDRPAH